MTAARIKGIIESIPLCKETKHALVNRRRNAHFDEVESWESARLL